jgi:hypothetical protein
MPAREFGMVVDDRQRVNAQDDRFAAAPTQRIGHGDAKHQPAGRTPGSEIESRIADIDVRSRIATHRQRHSPRELEDVEATVLVDRQQHVVRFDRRVFDHHVAMPGSPDEMPARPQFDLPPGIRASCQCNPHDIMRGGLHSGGKAGLRGVVPGDLR